MISIALWPLHSAEAAREIKPSSLVLPAQSEPLRWVRVALAQDVPQVIIDIQAAYRIHSSDGRELFRGNRMVGTRIEATADGIRIGPQVFFQSPITIHTDEGGIKLGGRLYRDSITLLHGKSGRLSVVNALLLEDYLKGVLPIEVNPNWPFETLKAQAIASRTYAIFKSLENRDAPFSMTRDVLSQVYAGKSAENSITSRAVDETAGQILTYGGKIFPTYFHSTCGGKTTAAETNWDIAAHPSLRGVDCPFCQGTKHYRWEGEFSVAEIQEALKKNGFALSRLEDVTPVDLDASGRAQNFLIRFDGKSKKLRANDLRLWLDPFRLRSTFFRHFGRSGNTFQMTGRGWGHGAGMCQWGSEKLGELGYSHSQILDYYYPDAQVRNLV